VLSPKIKSRLRGACYRGYVEKTGKEVKKMRRRDAWVAVPVVAAALFVPVSPAQAQHCFLPGDDTPLPHCSPRCEKAIAHANAKDKDPAKEADRYLEKCAEDFIP
jgi:hypothetical protein